MKIDILSLFPASFAGPLNESMVKKAREKGIIEINLIDIRDFAEGKHKKVDDRPFGGGPGMVLMAPPVCRAIRSLKTERSYVIYLSPQGDKLDYKLAKKLAVKEHLILLAGHYEGIDQRIIEKEVDQEISIGDYVLTSGCLPSLVLTDVIIRFIPGVLGHPDAALLDSFEKQGIFKGPQYTKPVEFEGLKVPDVLLSGHHGKIENWRQEEGVKKTKKLRSDLYRRYQKAIKKEHSCESH